MARLCWALDRRPWLEMVAEAAAGLLFVAGCLVFYRPSSHTTGVTLFLSGSVLMLGVALGRLLVRYGPSR